MQASPTPVGKTQDGKNIWGIRIWDPTPNINGGGGHNATTWSGQAVTVEARSGKSWVATVGTLVRSEKDGMVGIYRDAKNDFPCATTSNEDPADNYGGPSSDTRGQEANMATPERMAQIAENYRAARDSGHLAEVREFFEDDILPVRRLIKQALEALRLEADLSAEDARHALHVFDKLANLGHVDDEVPFEGRWAA